MVQRIFDFIFPRIFQGLAEYRIPSINSQRCGDEQYHSGLDSSLRFLALVAGFRSLGVVRSHSVAQKLCRMEAVGQGLAGYTFPKTRLPYQIGKEGLRQVPCP